MSIDHSSYKKETLKKQKMTRFIPRSPSRSTSAVSSASVAALALALLALCDTSEG